MNEPSREREFFMYCRLSQEAAAARRSGDQEALRDADSEFLPHIKFTTWPLFRTTLRRERLRIVDAEIGA